MRKGVTLTEVHDEDWKTQVAQGYSNIPPYTIVDVVDEDFYNFYGSWYKVVWNDILYYVSKESVSLDPEIIKLYGTESN